MSRARLVAMTGPLAGSTFPVGDSGATIGRGTGCDVVLADATVSRRHCVVRPDGDEFVIEELGSRHGTRVGCEPVMLRTLRHGDRIHVGQCTLAFEQLGDVPVREIDPELADTDESVPSLELALDDHAPLTDTFDASQPARALGILARVSASLGALTSLAELEHAVLEGLLDALPAERAGLIRLGPRDALTISRVLSRSSPEHDAAPLSRTIARHAARTRTAVVERDVAAHAEMSTADSVAALGARAVACVPLISRDRVVGVAYVDGAESTRFSEHDLQVAAAIAGLAAMPLELAWRGAAEAEAAAPEAASASRMPDPRPVLACVGSERLHLGDALAMAMAFERFRGLPSPRVLLLEPGNADQMLQRLALLPEETIALVAAPAKIATLGRLALSWVATLDADAAPAAPRAWLTRLVAATALVVCRASWCAWIGPPLGATDQPPRADPGLDTVLLARRVASRIQKIAPGLVSPVLPLMPSMPPLLSLDGTGPMGASARGTVWVNDTDEVIARKIRSAKTDTHAALDPEAGLSREVANLVLMHAWTSGETVESLLQRHAGAGYGALKQGTADAVIAYLGPVRARIDALRSADLSGPLAQAAAELESAGAELERAVAHGPG